MTRSNPPLTVALLTYNRVHYLKEAVAAILGQTFSEFEFLILDNHSTDGTRDFIQSLTDPRIRYVRNAPGTSVQFNCLSAYHIACGDRIIATHDDDIMEPQMLERQMRLLDENPGVGLVWTHILDIDQNGASLGKPTQFRADRIFPPGEYLMSFLRERLWPMPSGVMFRRALLPRSYTATYLGTRPQRRMKHPLDAAGIEDVLLPARINQKHAVAFLGHPWLKRRLHTNQFTHVASLSRPGVYLYRGLRMIARKIPAIRHQAFQFDAYAARFEIQDAITSNKGVRIKTTVSRRTAEISALLDANSETCPEAFLSGLPIVLLNAFICQQASLTDLESIDVREHHTTTRKLLAWLKCNKSTSSHNILEPLQGHPIIIFGSAFVAALLILEARRCNLPIVACVDSNTNRQGTSLLGVPIRSPQWMREHVTAAHIVILSSERDHEHYIEAIVRQNLQFDTTITSWKQLIE